MDIIANMKLGGKGLFRLMLLITFGAAVSIISGVLNLKSMCLKTQTTMVESIKYRNIHLAEQEVKFLHFYTNDEDGTKQLVGINPDYLETVVYENIYRAMVEINYNKDAVMPSLFPKVCTKEIYESCYKAYYSILNDIKVFPVQRDSVAGVKVYYEDSFGEVRSYGGNRIHEGTDIMAGNNESGYFTVVSMTDGVIEKMGWLELGGYRIGIRSPSGGYYYYAHLDSYAEGLKEGDSIKAGTKLGMMGDTGYGKEVTKGKFDVHLHLGVYYGENEISFNPFYLLKIVDNAVGREPEPVH